MQSSQSGVCETSASGSASCTARQAARGAGVTTSWMRTGKGRPLGLGPVRAATALMRPSSVRGIACVDDQLARLEPGCVEVRRREPLADDRAQNSAAVPKRPEIALAVHPVELEARHLDDSQLCFRSPDVDQRLDLEPVAVDPQLTEAGPPEGVEAVAE